MSSILLGSLAYSGIDNSIPKSKSKSKNKLDSVYDSNIENKMNIIERQQSRQNFNKPEFLNQFDDLRLDNISEPVGVNDSYKTISGVNTSLQRNLDFANGYSLFQETDMHYDVVSKDQFTHNNMVPNTSRRDFSVNADRSQRKLEAFSGVDPLYVAKKEKVPLFQPMPDLTWVNGMPVVTSELQKRYLPSNKNNFGNLPFEHNVRVKPGLEMENQEGNYSVYRVNPRNIDALRSEINQKVSYESKPLETIKKGEFRGPDPNLTKYKLPDFRQTDFGDLLPSKAAIEAPKQTGEYTDMKTQRNEAESYMPGHAVNTTIGDGPDKGKTRFEPAKRESYANDFAHGVGEVNNKPVMTNAKSFKNYDNQRASTNIEYEGPVSNAAGGNGGLYAVDYKDVPLTTLRELMIHGNTNIGISNNGEKGTYVFSNDMVLPVTHRETQSENNPILGPNAEIKMSIVRDEKDVAKMTTRQTTNHNIILNARGESNQAPIYNNDPAKMTLRPGTNHNLAINARGEEKQVRVYNNDTAKMTLRPGTNHNLVINARGEEKQAPVYNEDKAKSTLRQGTNHNLVINARGEEKQAPVYNEDKAKSTLRQGTSHNLVINARSEEKQAPVYNEDKAKTTLRQGTSHNLVINARSEEKQAPVYNDDQAKNTVKQTTLFMTPAKNLRGEIEQVYTGLQDDAKPTIKQTTIISNRPTGNPSKALGNYARDKDEVAKPTIRQQTEETQYIGHVGSKGIESTYVRDKEEVAKPTIRQQTEETKYIGHVGSNGIESTYVRDKDEVAKPTIRQQTEETIHIGHANAKNHEATYVRDKDEVAKTTIRQQTEQTKYIGHANAKNHEATYVRDKDEVAKPTIKQTTIYATPAGRLNNSNMGNYARDVNDEAKVTIKQTTMLQDYTGGLHGEIDAQISHEAANNMTIDDRREISTYNRAPNGKGDQHGPYIDEENVRFNDKKTLYSYVSNPHKPLDHSVMPTTTRETIETVYSMSKPVIETSTYYVNPYFINTLKNNPLVNDIYHQKNV